MALRILLDTMHIFNMFSDKRYLPVASAIDDEKVDALISVVSLTELIKLLGSHDMKSTRSMIRHLKSSNIEIEPIDNIIAEQAGYLGLKYKIPTADALIGETGIVCNADHILTSDAHFNSIRSLIKPIDIDPLLKKIKKL